MVAERAWIFAILVEDAPGSLRDVLSVFSYRGVSIESVLGFGRPISATGLVILGIRCPEKRARELERVARRLSVVARVHRLDAPSVASDRAVVIERRGGAGGQAPTGSPADDLTWLPLAGPWALVMGPEPVVRRYLRDAIDRGEVGSHVEVLVA